MKFYIVDAFTEEVFGGNPAGIVLLPEGSGFPDDSVMIKTAAELRYSETAFIKQISASEFKLRYFTPAAEVDFCGHATVAAFTVLFKSGYANDNSSYIADTLSGKLSMQIKDGLIMMDMPAAKLIKRFDAQADIIELYTIMGIDYEPVKAGCAELLPILISTGFPDIFMPVKDNDALSKIAPDFKALSAFSEKHGAGGVHAFTLDTPDPEITAYTRNFAPLFGIDEEAATGTASGGLAFYLYSHGIAPVGTSFLFLQGEAMGRPSVIIASIKPGAGDIGIKVGGKGAILAKGDIYL